MLFEDIASKREGKVERTKLDLHTLTEKAAQNDVALALDGRGSFIFPKFQSMVDGMMVPVLISSGEMGAFLVAGVWTPRGTSTQRLEGTGAGTVAASIS